MSDIGDKLEKLVETIKTDRDELRVRLHLLKAEAKDEWDEVEEKWRHLEPKLKQLRDGAVESGEDIAAATSQLAEEIGNAYKRLRKVMK
jgi:chromosome segregation ATPase